MVQRALQMVSLLILLIQASKTAFKVDLNDKVKLALSTMVSNNQLTQLQTYVLAKFVCLSDQSAELRRLIAEKVSGAHGKFGLDFA